MAELETALSTLLSRIRGGDSCAFELLLSQYRPMLSVAVSSLSLKGEVDEKEANAEAMAALYRAALSYRAEDGRATFGAYARRCVRNALISRFLRTGREEALPLESLDAVSDSDVELSDVLVEEEAVEALHGRIRAVLSLYEAEVFRLYAAGYRTSAIAAHLRKDEKSVSNAISRSLHKLRTHLSEN